MGEQLDIEFAYRIAVDPADPRKRRAFDEIERDRGCYRDDFPEWLDENWHVWTRFDDEANRVRHHRDHYSARTIIEYLRHNTTLSEHGGEYKLNNNFVPDVSRLYMTLRTCPDFFETRLQPGAQRVK